jgi:rare lipoprotein A
LPFGSIVRVTNVIDGRWVKVRINDRGPFMWGRIVDLSQAAARELGIEHGGMAKVRLEEFVSDQP